MSTRTGRFLLRQPGVRAFVLLAVVAVCLWSVSQAVAVVCYDSCVETPKKCVFQGPTDYPTPTGNRQVWMFSVTQYSPNLAEILWNPTTADASPDNNFSGLSKSSMIWAEVDQQLCTCSQTPSTGGPDVPGEFRPTTYTQYCNHCGTW